MVQTVNRYHLSCGGVYEDLVEALRASRAMAAKIDSHVEVRDNFGLIMGVSLPPSNMDGRPIMARAQRNNFAIRAGSGTNKPGASPSSNVCRETGSPHNWWLQEGPPVWEFACQDCRAIGYQMQGRVLAQRCHACAHAAVGFALSKRNRRQWSCSDHAHG